MNADSIKLPPLRRRLKEQVHPADEGKTLQEHTFSPGVFILADKNELLFDDEIFKTRNEEIFSTAHKSPVDIFILFCAGRLSH